MNRSFACLVLCLLILSNVAFAAEIQPTQMKMQLQTLDNYIVTLKMSAESSATITQSFDIVNRYKEPIIPGRAKLVLFSGINPTNIVVSIGGSQKLLSEDDVIEEDGNKVIYYEIWRPITRNERLTVEVKFDTFLEPQGILFKQLNLNFGEPEIRIEKMIFNLILPSGNHITFSEPNVIENNGNSVVIEIPANLIKKYQSEAIDVEYSVLPLPLMPFHGYWLWLLLIIMSAGIALMRILSRKSGSISAQSE